MTVSGEVLQSDEYAAEVDCVGLRSVVGLVTD